MIQPPRRCQWQHRLLLLGSARRGSNPLVSFCSYCIGSVECHVMSFISCAADFVPPSSLCTGPPQHDASCNYGESFAGCPSENKVKIAKTTSQVLACLKPCNGQNTCYRFWKPRLTSPTQVKHKGTRKGISGSRLASCCTEKAGVLVGKLYRGTGGGGGARGKVLALADRGSVWKRRFG